MSEIDEDFGRYLDSLVEPVEPEWVMGFVARRRRRRALIVTGFGVALAATTVFVGYEIQSPTGTGRVHTATGSSTTGSTATTSSTVAPSTSTTRRLPRNGQRTTVPPTTPPTTPVTTGPASADYRYAQAGDAYAATTFASSSLTVGVPVEITVTLINARDYGVFVDDGSYPLAVSITRPGAAPEFVTVGFGSAQVDNGVNLAPHAVVTATVSWTPTIAGSGTARLAAAVNATAGQLNLTQAATPYTAAGGPDTTTTTSTVPATTTTTT